LNGKYQSGIHQDALTQRYPECCSVGEIGKKRHFSIINCAYLFYCSTENEPNFMKTVRLRVQTVLYSTAETKDGFIKLHSHSGIESAARSVKSGKNVIFQ